MPRSKAIPAPRQSAYACILEAIDLVKLAQIRAGRDDVAPRLAEARGAGRKSPKPARPHGDFHTRRMQCPCQSLRQNNT